MLAAIASPHAIRVTAAAADIDELQHVSNLVYLQWVLQAAREHSAEMGYSPQAYRELGAVFIVRRHEIDYVRPALLGDVLTVSTWVDTWKRASCSRRTELVRHVDGQASAEVVAKAVTTWAFVEFATGRPTRIPDALLQAFAHPS